jgi:hypothetical protein
MAKSGMYLDGRELLVCELDKLSLEDKIVMNAETEYRNTIAIFRPKIVKPEEKVERRLDPDL